MLTLVLSHTNAEVRYERCYPVYLYENRTLLVKNTQGLIVKSYDLLDIEALRWSR